MISKTKIKTPRLAGMLITFIFVDIAWIFFRAGSLHEAFYILGNMFYGIENIKDYVLDAKNLFYMSRAGNIILASEIIVLLILDLIQAKTKLIANLSRVNLFVRIPLEFIFVIAVILLSLKGDSIGFVYQAF